jgi:tetratricopeptide (TPR) repeat protein
MTRQLTAIMFADMVGYTALMQEDEGRAKRLRDRQREVLEDRVAAFEGEILQYYGDGALCGFQSAVQAVECAIAVQSDLKEEPTVPVRIGLHLGDVAFDKTGVYGDGVNVAARVQALSVPGGVLISGKVADEVSNHPEISTQELARVTLKNVKDPQRVFAVTNPGLDLPSPKDIKSWPRAGKSGRKNSGLMKGLGWGAGVVALGSVAWFVATNQGPPADLPLDPLSPDSIAILPFSYHGAEEYNWTGEGIAISLSTALGGGVFLPVDQPSIRSWVNGPEGQALSGQPLWQRVAEKWAADLVLHGDVVALRGGVLEVSVHFFDPHTHEGLESISERGTEEELLDLTRRLAGKVVQETSGADPSILAELELISVEALQAFVDGEREFRAGNYSRAVGLLMEATEADPGFAMAHYKLSQAALWDWRWADARAAAENAWDLGSTLSPVNQRLLEAWLDFSRSDPDGAEFKYGELLEENPQSTEVLAGLGTVLLYYNSLRGRPSQAAEYYFQRVLEIDPNYGEVRYHIMDAAARSGDEEEFDRWYRGMNQESPQAPAFEAVRAFAFGGGEDQGEVIRRLRSGDGESIVFAAGRLATVLRDFEGARQLGGLLLDSRRDPGQKNAGHAFLSALAFAQGKWREAEEGLTRVAAGEPEWSLEMRALFSILLNKLQTSPILEEDLWGLRSSLEDLDPDKAVRPSFVNLFGPHAEHHQEFRLYLLGLLAVELGDFEKAREQSQELRAYGAARETLDLTYALSQSVDAAIDLAQDRPGEALTKLESVEYFPDFELIFASPFFSRTLDRWLRAELLRASGDQENALAWYATLSDGWGEFLFAGPAHLRQGEIHAELDDREEAIRHFQRFEELWADADLELQPLVDEARAERERLMAAGGSA